MLCRSVTDTAALPIEQHHPAVVTLSRGYPDGCHIPGHVHLGSLVELVHPGAREGQTEHLEQWLGRAVSKAKKPSSHSPGSGQCQQQQQQQAQGSPAPMAGPGLHLRAQCGQWDLEQTDSGKVGVEEVWVMGVALLSPGVGTG